MLDKSKRVHIPVAHGTTSSFSWSMYCTLYRIPYVLAWSYSWFIHLFGSDKAYILRPTYTYNKNKKLENPLTLLIRLHILKVVMIEPKGSRENVELFLFVLVVLSTDLCSYYVRIKCLLFSILIQCELEFLVLLTVLFHLVSVCLLILQHHITIYFKNIK